MDNEVGAFALFALFAVYLSARDSNQYKLVLQARSALEVLDSNDAYIKIGVVSSPVETHGRASLRGCVPIPNCG